MTIKQSFIKEHNKQYFVVYTISRDTINRCLAEKEADGISADFEELRKVLESYGYTMRSPSGGSSHMTFRKHGHPPITIPRHEPIKKVYVLLVREIVEQEEQNNEQT